MRPLRSCAVGELVYWNPRRPPKWMRRAPRRLTRVFARPVRNFGDLLGPLIVPLLLQQQRLPASTAPNRRLLTIGSILHLARAGDVVWGSGRNGHIAEQMHHTDALDVRAVRGPLTRELLLERGADCPEVFGDPALLLPMVRPDLVELSRRKHRAVTFVSHMHDRPQRPPRGVHTVSALADVERVLRAIVQSELVVATSLHGVIVAEAFGVPARSIVNHREPEFKFADYYLGTGRPDYLRASSVREAVALGGETAPVIDLRPLIEAFPIDLFT